MDPLETIAGCVVHLGTLHILISAEDGRDIFAICAFGKTEDIRARCIVCAYGIPRTMLGWVA